MSGESSKTVEQASRAPHPRFEEAVTQHFQRMERVFEDMSDRMARMELRLNNQTGQGRMGARRDPRFERREAPVVEEEQEQFEEEEEEEEVRPRRGQERRGDVDSNLGSIKMKIPSFQGKSDPEAYLEWEKKVELIFECHNYSEEKKVKLVVVEFTDYAIVWWDQLVQSRRRNRERPLASWDELKQIMRRRFVPSHYYRTLYQKLQSLRQGSKSVDAYFKEMEVLMIRADVVEDREATMARFLSGLNQDIAERVELNHYVEVEDMVHMAEKIERQLRSKGRTQFSRPSYPPSTTRRFNQNPNWKDTAPRGTPNKPQGEESKGRVGGGNSRGGTSTTPTSATRSRDFKCWKCFGTGHIANQCPNKRTMIMRDDGEVESEPEVEEEAEAEDELFELAEVEKDYSDCLVVQRALHAQVKVGNDLHRENIFHTRCRVQSKVCSLIIDPGSCTNVASSELVDKLKLSMIDHPNPYKLQWLNDTSDIKVTKQVLVTFQIGKYKDDVLCDVVPMEACHVLLGRPCDGGSPRD